MSRLIQKHRARKTKGNWKTPKAALFDPRLRIYIYVCIYCPSRQFLRLFLASCRITSLPSSETVWIGLILRSGTGDAGERCWKEEPQYTFGEVGRGYITPFFWDSVRYLHIFLRQLDSCVFGMWGQRCNWLYCWKSWLDVEPHVL